MHFVAPAPRGPLLLAELVESSGMQVFDFTQPPLLREAALRMETYADTPMDFADATLMLLAEQVEVTNIATLDRRGFSTYRTRDRKALSLVLQEAPSVTG
jgi:predicted nucleic acid-binding protein